MNKEDKELLLKDLCARLPYHPKIHVEHRIFELIETVDLDMWGFDGKIKLLRDDNETFCYISLEECKPYLRPMSSMTKKEEEELMFLKGQLVDCDETNDEKFNGIISEIHNLYLSHHIDFMGLIPKGLAIEVTEENNPYKNYNYD